MKVALGADHAGYVLKEKIARWIVEGSHSCVDLGARDTLPSDYPDFAEKVGASLQEGSAERGILVCGSGVGVSVAANKLRGVRAGLCHDTYSARQGVEHDDMNVLVLGSRIVGEELARELAGAFLSAIFSGEERHRRRLEKVAVLERRGGLIKNLSESRR